MTGLVLDASTTLAWAFDDESSEFTDAVLDALVSGFALVPSLWSFEVANGIANGVRRGRVSTELAEAFSHDIGVLDIRVLDATTEPLVLASLALECGLTAYDASYLAVARMSGLPLATRDKALISAAEATGVVVLNP